MLCLCLMYFIVSVSLSATTKALNSYNTNVTMSADTNQDPCTTYNPTLPNFKTAGRKLSEIKCDEYAWLRMSRQEAANRRRACWENKIKQQEPRPHFAIGGRNALPGEFPHMGALGWKAAQGTWVFKCGSTLISPKYTLTAAHCSKTPPDPRTSSQVPQIVRFGDKNIIDVYTNGLFPIDANIKRIILHPRYKSPSKYNDIALIELDKEMEFSRDVQPACLWTYFDTSILGTKATLTGWGVIETATRKTSPILQAAVVDILEDELCNRLLKRACSRKWCGLQDQICAGKLAGGVDACQGDSGGPLQVKIPLPPTNEGSMHYVIGVTSFGVGCAQTNLPGVYTRVSTHIDWIESIVWPDVKLLWKN